MDRKCLFNLVIDRRHWVRAHLAFSKLQKLVSMSGAYLRVGKREQVWAEVARARSLGFIPSATRSQWVALNRVVVI